MAFQIFLYEYLSGCSFVKSVTGIGRYLTDRQQVMLNRIVGAYESGSSAYSSSTESDMCCICLSFESSRRLS